MLDIVSEDKNAAKDPVKVKNFQASNRWREGFCERYTKETAALDDPQQFHSKSEYQELMQQQRAGTLQLLARSKRRRAVRTLARVDSLLWSHRRCRLCWRSNLLDDACRPVGGRPPQTWQAAPVLTRSEAASLS